MALTPQPPFTEQILPYLGPRTKLQELPPLTIDPVRLVVSPQHLAFTPSGQLVTDTQIVDRAVRVVRPAA